MKHRRRTKDCSPVARVPSSAEIRARLSVILREAKLLRGLLRVANARAAQAADGGKGVK